MNDTIDITYTFNLPEGKVMEYEIQLDQQSISLVSNKESVPPEWTRLENQQCENSPLKPDKSPHCPLAVNLAELIETFKNDKSSNEALIKVKTKERTYEKKASLQIGLFSIFGIIMATSGCPVMDFLRPMARFHLPFSSSEETIIRSVSMYLLKQYFDQNRGLKADLELKKLEEHYEDINKVNQGIINRINTIVKSGDANNNAIVILDSISQMLNMALEEKLDDFEYLFPTDS